MATSLLISGRDFNLLVYIMNDLKQRLLKTDKTNDRNLNPHEHASRPDGLYLASEKFNKTEEYQKRMSLGHE